VPGGDLRRQSQPRLLPDPILHPKCAARHPVVGVLLDQRRRRCRQGQHRTSDRSHSDNAVHWVARSASQSLLRQGRYLTMA